jgi:hypothetical protein
MNTLKTILITLLFAMSYGCSNIHIPSDFSTQLYPNHGILVVSSTTPTFDESVGFQLVYHVDKIGGSTVPSSSPPKQDSNARGKRSNYIPQKFNFRIESAQKQEDSDFSDADGIVFAQLLPKGKYELSRWSIATGIGLFIHPKELEPIHFDVTAGEITYLGNLHMNNSYGKNIFGVPLARGGIVSFADKEERDMKVFKEKAPKINLPIKKQLPQTPIWLPKGMSLSDLETIENANPDEK